MTPEQVVAFAQNLGGAVTSGPNGIEWGPIRFERGGGIAGHAQEWWITSPGIPEFRCGPFRTVYDLQRWLRNFIRNSISAADFLTPR